MDRRRARGRRPGYGRELNFRVIKHWREEWRDLTIELFHLNGMYMIEVS